VSESEVIDLVWSKVAEAGSMRALARKWGVTPSYVSDLLGGRRSPGPMILNPLGLKRIDIVDYLPKSNKSRKS
jgi:hypothetical protein